VPAFAVRSGILTMIATPRQPDVMRGVSGQRIGDAVISAKVAGSSVEADASARAARRRSAVASFDE